MTLTYDNHESFEHEDKDYPNDWIEKVEKEKEVEENTKIGVSTNQTPGR